MLKLQSKDIKEIRHGGDWNLVFDGIIYETVKARELYNLLVENAFYHNEPGVFFTDRVERDNNAWWAFKLDRTNPCGEISMPPYSLCCLGSMNLALYIKDAFEETASFDYESFAKDIKIAVRFLDNVLDATQYPLEKIEKFSKQWRRVGLGFTGLGDALAMMRIPYGSDESKKFAYQFSQEMMIEAYKASALLAAEKGMAPGFKVKKLFKKSGVVDERIFNSKFLIKLPIDVLSLIGEHGLRNVGLLTCAPTGTISLSLGNNCSSGIEPIFSLSYDRNIRTGRGDETRKETVYDYAYLRFLDWAESKGMPRSLSEADKKWFSTTFDVKPEDAIELQSIIQEHVDHSISKTLNFDGKAIGIEGYKHLFEYAYDRGLKGFTSFNTTSGCTLLATRIHTEHGVMSLGDIFEYQGYDEEELDNYTGWLPINIPLKVYDELGNLQDIQELFVKGITNYMYRVTVESGDEFYFTGEHQLQLADGSWKTVASLQKGEDIKDVDLSKGSKD